MSAQPPRLTGVPRFRIHPVRGLLALGCLGAVVLMAWFFTWRVGNSRAVRRAEAAIRQRGEPLTLADLAQRERDIPADENAAAAMLDLWESEDPGFWRGFRSGKHPLPKQVERRLDPVLKTVALDRPGLRRDQPLDPEIQSAADALLRERSGRLEAVRAALRRPQARFPHRWMEGGAMQLPYLSAIRGEGMLFHLEALGAIERGDVAAALGAFQSTVLLQRLLAEEPILIAQWVRLRLAGRLIHDLERLMTRVPLSPAQLAQVREVLLRLDLRDGLEPTMQVERVLALGSFDLTDDTLSAVEAENGPDAEATVIDPKQYRTGQKVLRALGLTDVDRRLMLETLGEGVLIAKQGTPESVQKFEERFERADLEARAFPPRIFSLLLLPSLSRAATRFAEFEAQRRAALTAVAVERYRQEHQGRLPETLSELPLDPAELRVDPLDGAPMRFRRLSKGYEVYSVGGDRVDDGGREKPAKGNVGNFDITFFVER
ncbi:MAG: hypothetical protein JNL10_16605 [Verrucomicrobiales bacterium]|nr:hypothetical protein [Verrucomicrobiales bacterium]